MAFCLKIFIIVVNMTIRARVMTAERFLCIPALDP